MEILQTITQQPRKFRLRSSFLQPYFEKGDPFKTLLARSTYLNKYCRDHETWTDTICRVVSGSLELDPRVTEDEGEQLFHLFWTGQAFPPGRGLWTGGIDGIPADARFNCWFATIRSPEDWCWVMERLMLGGGVSAGLEFVHELPGVAQRSCKLAIWCRSDHPDISEVETNPKTFLNGSTPVYRVADSREGWVEAERRTLRAAFEGTDLIVDVSDVRRRGSPIRTFGGIACGPAPLANLLRKTHAIVRGAAGRKMTSVEALDITDFVGFCVKSGNVRRSAILALGNVDDQAFRSAKKDWGQVASHRHVSNNSIAFRSWKQIENFDWHSLVADMFENGMGEPGLVNLPLAWRFDPTVQGLNPCFSGDTLVAVADGRNAISFQQLAEEGKDVPVYSMDKRTGKVEIKMGRHPRVTGYQKKLLRVWLDDGSHLDVTPEHEFLLLDGAVVLAKDLEVGASLPRFTKSLESVKAGGKDYYHISCDAFDPTKSKIYEHRLVAQFSAPEEWAKVYAECKRNGFARTGGLVVHHKDYNPLNNSPDNLQIMSFREHTQLHGDKDNNGVNNGRWSGFSSSEIRVKALELTRSLGRRFHTKEWQAFAKSKGLPQAFSTFRRQELGSVVDLSRWCALEAGYQNVGEDYRVVKVYHSMLEQGYSARIEAGKVLVVRTCEGCAKSFEIVHSRREQAFCSDSCGMAYVNGNASIKERRVRSLRKTSEDHMRNVRVEQARVCSALKFQLGRYPIWSEWSDACHQEKVPARIGPTLRFGYRHFNEVLEACDNYNHKVARVENLSGQHTVYNITVDDHHTVAIITGTRSKRGNLSYSGVIVPQCGEIFLQNYEACCLAEIYPAQFESSTDPNQAMRLITRYCLRQRLTPLIDPKADAAQKETMRIGVSLGGLCDFDWTPYQLGDWWQQVRTEANEYADVLGVARPRSTTTVKPSGTTSLMNGSSPGIHAPWDEHIIRRVRVAINDPMAAALSDAGVPFEYDSYDNTSKTLVFSFPHKAPLARATVQTQTLREQFERQRTVQEWWADNSVSATISFRDEDKSALPGMLKEFVPSLKSVSCLPMAHGYKQAPLESTDADTYHKLYAQINHAHPLTRGGDFDTVEGCAGGVCPIR